jgi:hypothetical protein
LISVGSVVRIYPGPPFSKNESEGELAQLGERLVCNQEVTGSIPVFSTNNFVTAVRLRQFELFDN